MSEVLSRIREAAAKASAGPLADARERPAFPRVAARSPFPPETTLRDLVDRFRLELEALAGSAYGPFDASGVAGKVTEILSDRNISRLLAWDAGQIECPGLAERLGHARIELIHGDVPVDGGHRESLDRLAQLEIGLSGAIAGLADTGSIIVASGPGRARVASLLPPVHIAVLSTAQLVPTMHDWLVAAGAELARSVANLVVITGCSRTADIELKPILGMHGPKELHVVLYQP